MQRNLNQASLAHPPHETPRCTSHSHQVGGPLTRRSSEPCQLHGAPRVAPKTLSGWHMEVPRSLWLWSTWIQPCFPCFARLGSTWGRTHSCEHSWLAALRDIVEVEDAHIHLASQTGSLGQLTGRNLNDFRLAAPFWDPKDTNVGTNGTLDRLNSAQRKLLKPMCSTWNFIIWPGFPFGCLGSSLWSPGRRWLVKGSLKRLQQNATEGPTESQKKKALKSARVEGS